MKTLRFVVACSLATAAGVAHAESICLEGLSSTYRFTTSQFADRVSISNTPTPPPNVAGAADGDLFTGGALPSNAVMTFEFDTPVVAGPGFDLLVLTGRTPFLQDPIVSVRSAFPNGPVAFTDGSDFFTDGTRTRELYLRPLDIGDDPTKSYSNVYVRGLTDLMTVWEVVALNNRAITSSGFGEALVVGDFRAPCDALLITDPTTGLEWLSPVATNNVAYNAVVAGFDGLVTTEGFSVATDAQVLALLDTHFGAPTTTQSEDNAPKAQAFLDVFGINLDLGCPAATPPGACPRTAGYAVTPSGDLRGIGMLSLGNGAEAYLIDATRTLEERGDFVSNQIGTWLIRPALPAEVVRSVPSLPAVPFLLGAVSIALIGAGLVRRIRRSATP